VKKKSGWEKKKVGSWGVESRIQYQQKSDSAKKNTKGHDDISSMNPQHVVFQENQQTTQSLNPKGFPFVKNSKATRLSRGTRGVNEKGVVGPSEEFLTLNFHQDLTL